MHTKMEGYRWLVLVVAVAGMVGAGCYRASGDGDGNGSRYDGGLDGAADGSRYDGATDGCSSDSDCAGDEVCSASANCLVNCTEDDAACTNSEVCRDVPSGERGCVPEGGGDTGIEDGGTDDTDGGGTGAGERYFVQIKDVTRSESPDGDDVCNAGDNGDIDTAGADIGGVELLDSNGKLLAWGTDDIRNIFTNARSNMNALGVLDGTSPTLADAPGAGVQCPSEDGTEPQFKASTVVSLGCKGSVVVGFQNADGEWLPIEKGYTVRVYEYATQCFSCYPNCPDSPSFGQEAVSVRICDSTSDPNSQRDDLTAASSDGSGNLNQCATSLGSGSGANLPFPY